MPTLRTFGYPGLDGSELETETRLDVERLLSRHTKVRYAGHHGILLPESHTGLGIRNLIFILLPDRQLLSHLPRGTGRPRRPPRVHRGTRGSPSSTDAGSVHPPGVQDRPGTQRPGTALP